MKCILSVVNISSQTLHSNWLFVYFADLMYREFLIIGFKINILLIIYLKQRVSLYIYCVHLYTVFIVVCVHYVYFRCIVISVNFVVKVTKNGFD